MPLTPWPAARIEPDPHRRARREDRLHADVVRPHAGQADADLVGPGVGQPIAHVGTAILVAAGNAEVRASARLFLSWRFSPPTDRKVCRPAAGRPAFCRARREHRVWRRSRFPVHSRTACAGSGIRRRRLPPAPSPRGQIRRWGSPDRATRPATPPSCPAFFGVRLSRIS